MKTLFSWKKLFLFTITLILSLFLFLPNVAEAAVRKTQEPDGQTLYQSRHQLRDYKQQSWQVVLFKREKEDKAGEVKLRLVGFPGKVEIAHPEPLILETDRAAWQAPDLFPEKSPAPNVGQYDLGTIIFELSQNNDLLLKIPEVNQEEIILKVPGVIVLEWKIVAGKN